MSRPRLPSNRRAIDTRATDARGLPSLLFVLAISTEILLVPMTGCAPAAAQPADPSTSTGSVLYKPFWKKGRFKGLKSIEDEIVRQVNVLRSHRGLSPLANDERLRVAARQHTLEMVSRGYYSHTSPVNAWHTPARRACLAGFLDPFIAENIGMVGGYTDAATTLVKSWIGSPQHLANMVDPRFTAVGVGVVSVKRGVIFHYATQKFASSPLDLADLSVGTHRKSILKAVIDLHLGSSFLVRVWRGRSYLGDASQVEAGVHRAVMELPLARSGSVRYSLGISRGNNPSLICVEAEVTSSDRMRVKQNQSDPTCRQIIKVSASARRISVNRRIVSGKARANTKKALNANYFFNQVLGSKVALRLGQYVSFSHELPVTNPVRFSFVVGGIIKDYLVIDTRKSDPFTCP